MGKMDFKFQAVFSHINPTNDQMKAILQDFWKKNEENQAEIIKLQLKEAESQAELVKLQRKETDSKAEIARLAYEYEKCKGENFRLREENNEHQGENVRLRQEYEQKLLEQISLLERENEEKLTLEIQKKTSEIKNQRELSKPSCPVCLEYFDKEARQPYALSCEHMVCAQCLHPVLSRRRRGGRFCDLHQQYKSARIGMNHPSKRCPVCRKPVTTELKKICLTFVY